MKSLKNIHIGSVIKQKQEERAITVAEFARQIGCDRTNVYDIYKRKSIDIELLIKISKVLNFDFINEIYLYKSAPSKIFFSIEMDTFAIEKLDLPDNFLCLIKP